MIAIGNYKRLPTLRYRGADNKVERGILGHTRERARNGLGR